MIFTAVAFQHMVLISHKHVKLRIKFYVNFPLVFLPKLKGYLKRKAFWELFHPETLDRGEHTS